MIQQLRKSYDKVQAILAQVKEADEGSKVATGKWLGSSFEILKHVKQGLLLSLHYDILAAPWQGESPISPLFKGVTLQEAAATTRQIIEATLKAFQQFQPFVDALGILPQQSPLGGDQVLEAWRIIDKFDASIHAIIAFKMKMIQ